MRPPRSCAVGGLVGPFDLRSAGCDRAANLIALSPAGGSIPTMSHLLAAIYDRLHKPAEDGCLAAWRAELPAPLTGAVFEIGAGTGANLPR